MRLYKRGKVRLKMPRYTLGLATTFHDPAIAILDPKGEVIFAEATERFFQYKRAPNCEPDPALYMESVLKRFIPPDSEIVIATTWSEEFTGFLKQSAGAGAFGLKTLLSNSPSLNRSLVPERAERTLIASLHHAQQRVGIGTLLALDRMNERQNAGSKIVDLRRYAHHLSHASYACLSSPFTDAACLVVDGMGETGASALYAYENGKIREIKRHRGRESIGFYFGLVTDLAGFDQTKGEEWKIMGLAPYGQPDEELLALLRQLYTINGHKLTFADAQTVQNVSNTLLSKRPVDALENGWADLARCGQVIFEDMMDVLLKEAEQLISSDNLIVCGGCALNSSFNGKITTRTRFKNLHVPSAPADDGNAIGAAWLSYQQDNPKFKREPNTLTPYLGSTVSTEPFERMQVWEKRLVHRPDHIIEDTARLLSQGKLIGWVQGRAEFGPRSLGNRSILADPRPDNAKALLNAKVKYREAFRPFAPSILAADAPEWFENFQDSPYMERTLRWREDKRARVPAVVHEDFTGRLQCVTHERNARFTELLEAFKKLTGVPVLLNTSFNVMGKPILHTSEEAILMFYTSGLDALVIDDWLLVKDASDLPR
jgi:carbamoyltransferase